jgi:biopolymer transport protein ExbB
MDVIRHFNEGGIFMYAILLFGILSFSLIVERALALYRNYKAPALDFRASILEMIRKGDLQQAENYAKTAGGSSLSTIVRVGCQIRSASGGDEELQARMDERLSSEISKIDRRTGFLAMFGNVATLIGLLGTIAGMIQSFAAVASASPSDRATLLSKGIAEAMNCTAFGLIVAIPALVAFAFFQNKTDRIVGSMTELTTEIYHDLLFFTEPLSASRSAHQAREIQRQGRTSNAPELSV